MGTPDCSQTHVTPAHGNSTLGIHSSSAQALRVLDAPITVGTRDAAFPLAHRAPRHSAGKERTVLDRIGILGFVGILIFCAWFIGWVFLGFHDGLYHVLFPVSVVLMVVQGVRRVAR